MKKVKNYIPFVLILVLFVAAVGLIFAITNQSNFKRLVSDIVPGNNSSTIVDGTFLPTENLSDEEKVLNFPGPTASNEDRKNHAILANKIAKFVNELNLNNCKKPNPPVIKIKEGENLKVNNQDSKSYKLFIDPTHIYTIAPKATTNIKVAFGKGKGLYGYSCEGNQDLLGIIIIQ